MIIEARNGGIETQKDILLLITFFALSAHATIDPANSSISPIAVITCPLLSILAASRRFPSFVLIFDRRSHRHPRFISGGEIDKAEFCNCANGCCQCQQAMSHVTVVSITYTHTHGQDLGESSTKQESGRRTSVVLSVCFGSHWQRGLSADATLFIPRRERGLRRPVLRKSSRFFSAIAYSE